MKKYLYGYDREGYVVVEATSKEEADAMVSGEQPGDYSDVLTLTTDPRAAKNGVHLVDKRGM